MIAPAQQDDNLIAGEDWAVQISTAFCPICTPAM